MGKQKPISWYEIRHRIYTLRRMRWRYWQLTDNEKRIVCEGTRGDCLDAIQNLMGGRHNQDFKLAAVPTIGR